MAKAFVASKGFVKHDLNKAVFRTREATRQFKRMADKDIIDKLNQIMRESTINVYHASQEIVPFDTGELKQSGIVESPAREKLLWRVMYGKGNGAFAPYAMVVHEGMRRNVDGSITVFNFQGGKKPKYVQQPFNEEVPKFQHRILTELDVDFQEHLSKI
jgi:hypothetical protein